VTNGSVKEEIKERIKNADTFYQLVRNIWLFRSYYMPILTYEAETCTWTAG
jgi:hypothetical protein